MKAVIPLDEMTTEDKLEAMELLWDDLCQRPDEVPSPSWHEAVLKSREGSGVFFSLDEVRARARKPAQCST
jgi:hypothetical protein